MQPVLDHHRRSLDRDRRLGRRSHRSLPGRDVDGTHRARRAAGRPRSPATDEPFRARHPARAWSGGSPRCWPTAQSSSRSTPNVTGEVIRLAELSRLRPTDQLRHDLRRRVAARSQQLGVHRGRSRSAHRPSQLGPPARLPVPARAGQRGDRWRLDAGRRRRRCQRTPVERSEGVRDPRHHARAVPVPRRRRRHPVHRADHRARQRRRTRCRFASTTGSAMSTRSRTSAFYDAYVALWHLLRDPAHVLEPPARRRRHAVLRQPHGSCTVAASSIRSRAAVTCRVAMSTATWSRAGCGGCCLLVQRSGSSEICGVSAISRLVYSASG